MSVEDRIRKYAEANFKGVMHTTLNPEGPGVVRIHLIPPVTGEDAPNSGAGGVGASVAIINGQDIIPVNTAWSVLLCEFIKQVNVYRGMPVSDADAEKIIKGTVRGVRKVFPLLGSGIIRDDIYTIMNTFRQIAYGEEPDEDIGYMNLGQYAPFMRAPHRMDLMVSAMEKNGHWNCNAKCVHCYAAGQQEASEDELSTEEWKAVIDKLQAIGVPQVTFTGGEPTMRDDLVELVEHSAWFVTRLNTNGVKLSRELCDRLMEASLDSLQITFYSDKPEVHNALVGGELYDKTVKGIENAIAAGLNLSINTPLCTLNKDYVSTLRFLHEKGVMYVTCSGLITTGNALTRSSEELQLTREEIKEVLKEAVDYCFENDMEISFTSPGWIEKRYFDELGITVPTCGACLSNMAVTPSGNVVPCQSWLSGDVLGNILTDDWKTIWNTEMCTERREYSAQMLGECPLRKFREDEAACAVKLEEEITDGPSGAAACVEVTAEEIPDEAAITEEIPDEAEKAVTAEEIPNEAEKAATAEEVPDEAEKAAITGENQTGEVAE